MISRKRTGTPSRLANLFFIVALLTSLFTGVVLPASPAVAAVNLNFVLLGPFSQNAVNTIEIRTIVMADFNLDGKNDLATTNVGINTVSVWLGNGDGTIGAATVVATGSVSHWGLAAGDVNLDGKPDLVVSVSVISLHYVGVLLGNGNGTFAPLATYSTGLNTQPRGIAIADFNEDGKPDVGVANDAAFTLLKGNGNGTFQTAVSFPMGGNEAYNLAVGDFNADHHLDVATSNHSSGTVGVLLGDGNGNFGSPSTYPAGGATPTSVAAGDFDNDHNLDLAVVNDAASNHTLEILKGNGDGTFTVQPIIPLGLVYPKSVVATDFDLDGKVDLAIGIGQFPNILTFKGRGDLTFMGPVSFSIGSVAPFWVSLVVGNMNGDTVPDIAVANYNANRISVLLNAAPVISAAVSPAPNAYGWRNTPVTVTFNCTALLGVASLTPAATLNTDGANQSVTGNCTDVSGNTDSKTVTGIDIDMTSPILIGTATTAPNANGWYNSDVIVHWTCSDALSGIDGNCPGDTTITGEGSNLQASAMLADRAGNQVQTTVSPVKIDVTPPNTTISAVGDWNNISVPVDLLAHDALSGVEVTRYILDGGSIQDGTSLVVSSEGIHSLEYWSVDRAGNEEYHHTAQIKIDLTPPSITHIQIPSANANGWNNTAVTVQFTCSDPLSGIASCTTDQTVSTEGQNQPVTGTAVDNANNMATDPAAVSIDQTGPEIGAAADRLPNAEGWYNAPVSVSFTCSDSLSGIASCPAVQTFYEGYGQSASGTAFDAAGNSAAYTLSNLNIDLTAPSLSGAAAAPPNSNGWYSGDVTIQWACSDSLSGIAGSCPVDSLVTGEGTSLSVSASVSDRAGNFASASVPGIMIDRTSPVLSYTASGGPNPYTPGTWANGAVTVLFACTDGLSGVDSFSGPLTLADEGSGQSATGTCSDKAGNTTSITVTDINIDMTAPVLNPTVSPATIPLNGSATVYANASDALSGLASQTCGALDTSTVGTRTVTCTATDNAGNTLSATASYTVISGSGFTFTGFFQPIDNPPTLNQVNAGRGVPVKFSLGGDWGLDIFASGYPASQQVSCTSGAPIDNVETTVNAGSSSLSYDPLTDQYTYVWKTEGQWAGTCRQFTIQFTDGSQQIAQFKFK